MQPESRYKSYILRVWQVERGDQPTTVAALEDCQTNERQAFPSLATLLEFLETGAAPAPPADLDFQFEEWLY
ncbi:MAG TPA: hypothetical protein PKZ84_06375 [Anaerolineae bacterium]|nr:hypothetical protein [Anaerolineae bacterium]HQI83313.1 hypothetical protein [Anaerolineae bacterium]